MTAATPTRRRFLQGAAAGLGAGLVLGFHLPARGAAAPAAAPAAPEGAVVNAWLRIAPDGAVTVYSNISELGQGTATGIAQILADELEVAWENIRYAMAPLEKAYENALLQQYATFGSLGIRSQFQAFQKAGAAARMMLVQAAADRWKVPAADCTARDGAVHHAPSGRKAAYGALAADAARLAPPADPPVKPREQWRLIGQPLPRLDVPAKVDGSAVYGVDVTLPDLRVATIVQCPQYGGRLVSVDEAPALAVRGVEKVVRLDNAVAVVAKGYWPAKKGLDALAPVWDPGDNPRLDSAGISARLHAAAKGDAPIFLPRDRTAEDVETAHREAMRGAVSRHEATYEVPFEHHATLEPMNGTARMTADGGVELWLPTQNQTQARIEVAGALGIPEDKVVIHTTLSGGGFGRRIEVDYAVQAALVAKKAGVPVKLIWSREEDMRHGFHRPAAVGRLEAGLDAQGNLVALRFDSAAPSLLDYSMLGRRPRIAAPQPVEFTGVMYSSRPAYALPGYRLSFAKTNVGVPCGFWRAVGASQNAFFLESFLDELAERAGVDPADYRRRLLTASPRDLGVLDAVVEASGWAKPAPDGRFRGLAMVLANGTSVGVVVEIARRAADSFRVEKVTVALDCGVVVNPDVVRAQTEGNVVWALTAAIHGGITIKGGATEQTNFDTYPLLALAETPAIEVVTRETGNIGGVGEEAVSPVAPALANALYRATGRRLRSMPFGKQGFTFA